jgi:hypothetical protein
MWLNNIRFTNILIYLAKLQLTFIPHFGADILTDCSYCRFQRKHFVNIYMYAIRSNYHIQTIQERIEGDVWTNVAVCRASTARAWSDHML